MRSDVSGSPSVRPVKGHLVIRVTDALLQRKRKAFRRYFGAKPKLVDMYGPPPFTETFDDLEVKCRRYRQWYATHPHKLSDVPEDLLSMYQIHHNLSNEALSRARLASEIMGTPLDRSIADVLKVRSIPIPVRYFNAAMVYASTIYRGKTQVDTGSWFEKKLLNHVSSIDDSVTVVPGKHHQGSKYDKDILVKGEYKLSAEVSFQVTTNSVMERKSHLKIPNGLTVIMIFGGLGWIERINALERIASPTNGYADCFGPSEKEFDRLSRFLRTYL